MSSCVFARNVVQSCLRGMRITKLGHSCLSIEDGEGKLLTDPGMYSTAQNNVTGVSVVLISHEHPDHFHIESLKKVLEHNPKAEIFTNKAVGRLLAKEDIRFTLLEHHQKKIVSGFLIEGYGEKHAEILPSMAVVPNTGFLINEKLFFPGDAFYNPKREIEALALPVCGPWLKLSEAIAYAKEVDPHIAFPIHDGMLKIAGPFHRLPEAELTKAGIEFRVLTNGQSMKI